jgi:hypothetical protein
LRKADSKKIDALKAREVLENQDRANLDNRVNLFSATLAQPAEETLTTVPVAQEVRGPCIWPKDYLAIQRFASQTRAF